jgi:signal transduction histidine kinase
VTFRTRILLACIVVAVLPLSIFAFGARGEVRDRLEAQFEERVAATSAVIRQDLARTAQTIDSRLEGLLRRIEDEPLLRIGLLRRGERATVLDFAGGAMLSANLDYLLLLDDDATVLSSGHFRNEFDRGVPAVRRLADATTGTLVLTRRAAGPFLTLVVARSVMIGDRTFVMAGGLEVDSVFVRGLARDDGGSLVIALDYPGGSITSDADAALDERGYAEQIDMPFSDDVSGDGSVGEARWTVTHSPAALNAVQSAIDRKLLAAIAGAILLALVIAQFVAARVNRPLEELALRSTRVDLERIDAGFETRRQDEIGTLSRMLDLMVHRLRTSANALRAAERRATVGDLARQVNHDVRNGLLPIRNVIRHLTEVSRDSPAELGPVFAERESTLNSGIAYLENLATNYARLAPRAERSTCDVNAIVRAVLDYAAADSARVRVELTSAAPRVTADPVALRRVIENLVVNAVESLPENGGSVIVRTAVDGHGNERLVTVEVTDTGAGIEAAALDHIFDDFYTTKERGTGLGLSIVRRLVADMGGRIGVESETGRGTTFRIELPETS